MATILVSTSWLLYGRVVRLWWTYDDLFHLHFLSSHARLTYFLSPRVWGELPFKMFTPLVLLSYQADLAFAPFRPEIMYGHQLLALAAAAIAVYTALRTWLEPPFASSIALLFLLGIPSESWAITLMTRHYVEGLICAALAARFFVVGLRERRIPAALISSLFYLLAMLEKEIYVPLIGLLLVLPESSLRSRLWFLRAHGVALVLYLGWRSIMLGTVVGGYGWAIGPGELPRLVARLPVRLAATLIRADLWSGILVASLLVGIGFLVARHRGALPRIAWALILIVAPIVKVAKSANDRFGVLLWLLVVVAFAFGCRELWRGSRRKRLASAALLLLAGVAAVACNRLEWRDRYGEAARMSSEGRFFLGMSPGDKLRHPHLSASAMNETRWLREERLGLPRGAGWFDDDVYLCWLRPAGRIWEYDIETARMHDVTASALVRADRYCRSLRQDVPLSARFAASDDTLFWDLGPYREGSYALIRNRGVQSIPVEPAGGYRITLPVLSLMVRYESPAGWVTYSPELTLDFRVARRFRWDRQAKGSANP